jgi:hypothetical protein
MRLDLNLPSRLAEESQSPRIAGKAVVSKMITAEFLFIEGNKTLEFPQTGAQKAWVPATTGKMRLPYLPNALLSSSYLAKDTVRNK